jgi:hypothetical protein
LYKSGSSKKEEAKQKHRPRVGSAFGEYLNEIEIEKADSHDHDVDLELDDQGFFDTPGKEKLI